MERAVTMMAALALALAGCEAATNAAAGVDAYAEKTAQKLEQTTDDASITLAVKGKLLEADDHLAKRVSVSTGSGIVSLTGSVASPADKAKAEAIAARVRGVARVINALDVAAP